MNSNSNYGESKAVREILEDQFNRMRPTEDIPEEMKKEVFSTLESLQFLADVADLFTVKFAKTELSFLDDLTNENENSLGLGEAKKDIEGSGR